MSSLDQQISNYLEISEEAMTIYSAPNFADKIWYKHKNKKITHYFLIVASVCMISLALWNTNTLKDANTDAIVAQNQALEIRLAQVSFIALTDSQQKIMNNWYFELELIDQNIEQQDADFVNPSLWPNRAQLLTQMIDFYLNPYDIYEI